MLVAAVADGLGGHEGGEVASYWAVREFLTNLIVDLRSGTDMVAAIRTAYAKADAGVTAHAAKGSATTLTAAIVDHGRLYLGNVGDSRCYVVSSGKLILRTMDHSFVRSLVDAGAIDEEEARTHPRKNIITRALGSDPKEPDIYCIGDDWDTVLLCSDGVCSVMSDDEIMRLVIVDGKAKTIVEMSLAKGGQDNSTAILLNKE
jgi:serine/threonine protein phosphatase PrpC